MRTLGRSRRRHPHQLRPQLSRSRGVAVDKRAQNPPSGRSRSLECTQVTSSGDPHLRPLGESSVAWRGGVSCPTRRSRAPAPAPQQDQ